MKVVLISTLSIYFMLSVSPIYKDPNVQEREQFIISLFKRELNSALGYSDMLDS